MIELSIHDNTSTVRITGRFDFNCVREFQEALRHTCRDWIVDLAETTFVDSSALGMLLLLRERATTTSGRVTVRHLHGQPRDVLLMAKFDRLFILQD
jgi:anti-anti-sigma factor